MKVYSPGDMVTDKVRLVRPLAEGGMGAVWIGHHVTLQTDVAVKFMAANLAADPSLRERFAREARSAVRVASPHIVEIKDFGDTADGTPYIVMELCRGESLRARLDRARVLSPQEVSSVVAQLTRALEAAHAAGVVHRDIKPDNLFLVEQSCGFFLKVLDFGIAKLTQDAQRSRALTGESAIGTVAYMSPEQLFTAAEVDARADLWATAVVAFEALTGALPFALTPIGAFFAAVRSGAFITPSTLPPAFVPFFRRAFTGRIEARHATAAELARAFDQAVQEASSVVMGISGQAPSSFGEGPPEADARAAGFAPTVMKQANATRAVAPLSMVVASSHAPPGMTALQSSGATTAHHAPPAPFATAPPKARRRRSSWVPMAAIAGGLIALTTTVYLVWLSTNGPTVRADDRRGKQEEPARSTKLEASASASAVVAEEDPLALEVAKRKLLSGGYKLERVSMTTPGGVDAVDIEVDRGGCHGMVQIYRYPDAAAAEVTQTSLSRNAPNARTYRRSSTLLIVAFRATADSSVSAAACSNAAFDIVMAPSTTPR